MKILLCTQTYSHVTHGPAKFAQLLLQINERFPKHEIRILTEGINSPIAGRVYKLSLSYPRPVYAFGKFIRMWAYHNRAMKIRADYPFDVLVYNDGIQGFYSAWRQPKDVAVVAMVNDDDYMTTYVHNRRDFPLVRKWAISLLHRWFEQAMAKRATLTLACSAYLRKRLLAEYRSNPDKTKVLYQTTDINFWAFRERPCIKSSDLLKVLFVKCDFKVGGLSYLIKALSLLTSHQFELVIVGPFDFMRKEVEQCYLPTPHIRYRFEGVQPQQRVRELMYESDLLCIPSLREGLGVANIEGLATGIPVISTMVGGIPEVLGDGQYGWLAEPGDTNSLKDVLLQCICSEQERQQKSTLGREHVATHFDHKQMLDRFLSLLSKAALHTDKSR